MSKNTLKDNTITDYHRNEGDSDSSKEKKAKKTDRKKTSSAKKEQEGFSLWEFVQSENFKRACGVFLTLFALFLLYALSSYFFSTWKPDTDKVQNGFWNLVFESVEVNNWGGKLGAYVGHIFGYKSFGIASYLLAFLSFIWGMKLLNVRFLPFIKTTICTFITILLISLLLGYIANLLQNETMTVFAGSFGVVIGGTLQETIGNFGTILFILFCIVAFGMIAFNMRFHWVPALLSWMKNRFSKIGNNDYDEEDEKDEEDLQVQNNGMDVITPVAEQKQEDPIRIKGNHFLSETKEENQTAEGSTVFEISNPSTSKASKKEEKDIDFVIENPTEESQENPQSNPVEIIKDNGIEHHTIDEPYDPCLDLRDFRFPTTDLLNDYGVSNTNIQNDELIDNKNRITETLKHYSIDITKIIATIGPTVTLYEIVPAPGVRISKIKNLEDDIALSLSALGIRIIAPIPGKGTIGIEVPNKNPQIVPMKSLLESDKFVSSKFNLPIALGKTIANEPYIADLSKMPHLLMAGATGQGKSVGLNAVIASLVYKKHPAELKFVMVDPKKVELSLYTQIERHYLAKLPDSEEAIITDTRKVVRTLNSLCIEMDQRYDLLKDAQVKNILEYNAKFISRRLNPNDGHRFLPYIVLIVDEFADLIMTAGKEVETPIARLAQLARAIGIHLIIATQRPSVNIITGVIKANFPARIAFRVTSKIDSRTILDMGGADQLIGRGDMLLSTGNDMIRLQCAFIDTPEIEKVSEFIGSQRGYPDAFHLPEYLDEESEPSKEFDPNQKDEMFEDAARVIVAHQHGSTSLLQRKLKLGYNRAGRLIDQLEAAGIVGPFEGSKAREVKIKTEPELEELLRELRG